MDVIMLFIVVATALVTGYHLGSIDRHNSKKPSDVRH